MTCRRLCGGTGWIWTPPKSVFCIILSCSVLFNSFFEDKLPKYVLRLTKGNNHFKRKQQKKDQRTPELVIEYLTQSRLTARPNRVQYGVLTLQQCILYQDVPLFTPDLLQNRFVRNFCWHKTVPFSVCWKFLVDSLEGPTVSKLSTVLWWQKGKGIFTSTEGRRFL